MPCWTLDKMLLQELSQRFHQDQIWLLKSVFVLGGYQATL